MANWDRYKEPTTGLQLSSYTGDVFYPRSYCDDPDIGPVGVYISKEPVCKLKLTPVVQFPNVDIAWDISQSMSATGTIATFDIEWGGTTDIGDLAGQVWASDPKTGDVQYTTVGTYTATAWVTDTLGKKSKRVRVTVTIVEKEQTVYIGTTDGGMFILTPTAAPAASNGSLSGNDLKFRALRLNPAYKSLPAGQRHLWAATAAGLAVSRDGGTTWSTISKATLGAPANDAGDDPAPATADLDQIDIAFDPLAPARVYVVRTTATRTWLYYSDDDGTTWSNEQVGV